MNKFIEVLGPLVLPNKLFLDKKKRYYKTIHWFAQNQKCIKYNILLLLFR